MKFERHVQTALTLLVVGLLGWIGWTVSDNSKSIAQILQFQKENERRFEATDRRVERLESAIWPPRPPY